MKSMRITLAVLGAALTLVVTACGGASDVPSGTVAVVAGTEIARTELDELVEAARKGYEATNRDFPKAGTPEYQNIQSQFVAYLVQRTEFEQAAEDLGIRVSEKDVDKALDDLVESRYDGDRGELEKDLKEQGFTDEMLRKSLRISVLSKKIFDEVTKDVNIPEADSVAYYQQNQSQFGTPESREVRHILIAEKGKNGQVDFEKSKKEAERIYQELQDGADFAALAKEFSDDPGTKDSGGKYTAVRGASVPEFEKVAFELETGAISRPVKTQYGYHVIEALGPLKAATPYAKVRNKVRATLLQQKRNEVMTEWVQDLGKKYEGKVTYAAGFEPPDIPETSTETQ